MNLLLIPLFAIFNRFRGASGFTIIGKAGAMIALFYLLWPSWIIGLLAAIFYLLGQSCGWGWWIGSIISITPSTIPVSGIRERIASWAGKRITSDYLWGARISLAVIGLFWWAPVIACFPLSWMSLAAIAICVFGFPLSFEIAIRLPKIKINLISHPWEVGEVIYGALNGLAIYLILN